MIRALLLAALVLVLLAPQAGSSAQPATKTQTVIITTDPATFTAEHVFDLGRVAAVWWKATVLTLARDGEAVGVTSQGADGYGPAYSSFDAVHWVSSGSSEAELSHADAGGVGWASCVSPRYLKVPISLVDQSGVNYTGPRHPIATVRIDIEYLAGY